MGAAGSTPRGRGCLSERRELGDGERRETGGEMGKQAEELAGRDELGGSGMHRGAGGEERDGGAG